VAIFLTARVWPIIVDRGDAGILASNVLMVRSLEEVWIVKGEYLFQSRERTSAWGCACIVNVAGC
jgi:hypothetical protein